MITAIVRNLELHLTKIRSEKILNRIGAGKSVFFENSLKGIAFKYIPSEIGKLSKYYIKPYCMDEYEIDCDSPSIFDAIMEGKPISKKKFDNYCIRERVSWSYEIAATHTTIKAVGT